MKIAIAGKGGVGKTTLAGLLARHFLDQGARDFLGGGMVVVAQPSKPDDSNGRGPRGFAGMAWAGRKNER